MKLVSGDSGSLCVRVFDNRWKKIFVEVLTVKVETLDLLL